MIFSSTKSLLLLVPFLPIFIGWTPKDPDLWYWFKGNDLDYWREGKKVKDPLQRSPVQVSKSARLSQGTRSLRSYDLESFDWTNYEDPSSPQFWDDGGDYVPPRPLRILAANPTKENAEKYKQWQRRKLQVSQLLTQLTIEDPESQTQTSLKDKNIPWSKIGLYYFYSSSCSACRSEKDVIAQIQSLGVDVTPVQIDWSSSPAMHKGSLNYDAHFKRTYDITSTPTFVVLGNRDQIRWEGMTTLDEFKSKVSELFK